MSYQVKCDRCGDTRDISEEFFRNSALPVDWSRLVMGRDPHATADIAKHLCPCCATDVKRLLTAPPKGKRCTHEN